MLFVAWGGREVLLGGMVLVWWRGVVGLCGFNVMFFPWAEAELRAVVQGGVVTHVHNADFHKIKKNLPRPKKTTKHMRSRVVQVSIDIARIKENEKKADRAATHFPPCTFLTLHSQKI